MTAKTLLVGLDAVGPDLIYQWSEQGLLPNLKKYIADWHDKPIVTAKGMGDSVFWTSVVTGLHPGNHGHYFPMQYNNQSYSLYRFNQDQEVGGEPFWQFCSKSGAKVCVLDIYSAPFRQGLNGIQVQDWLMHYPMMSGRSWPQSVIGLLHEKYLTDKFQGNTDSHSRTEQESIQFHEQIMERINAKGLAALDLLSENDWDLFCVSFADAHDVGHQSWHWHDLECPEYAQTMVNKHGNPLLQSLQLMDAKLGQLVEAGKAENIYIIAGLGMARQCAFNSVVQKALAHLVGLSGTRKELTDKRLEMPYYELPHNMNSAMIAINLKGRESQGIVEPEDYDKTCEYIAEKMRTLCDADTGESVVHDVYFLQKEYPGKRAQQLPDICVEWKKPMNTTRVRFNDEVEFGIQWDFMVESRQGDHTDQALLITNQHYKEETILAESLAPTLCRTLGVNMPQTDAPALSLA